jgi:class 3 adenylate cyclase
MKRKIAAIFAADVAGYSKLVAEDEEETLRRLESYRAVMDDFIARAGGRIFNTAGDAVLAEFSSAVEAVRCAIDIQESLRTRNMAYPPSRQMSFRIGITVGDVVERDGDLLGDGVNIAARLEGIAPVGGICISRTVHEQVANKLSVQFADIGEQQVKNIPTPVHAFHIEMRPDDARGAAPGRKPAKKSASSVLPVAVAVACVAALGVAVFAYLTIVRPGAPPGTIQPNPPPAASLPLSTAPTAAASSSTPVPAPQHSEALVPETIPFIPDRARDAVRAAYLPAADHKALAISTAPIGFSTGQADDATAEAAALDMCQKRADTLAPPRKCELYAIGNMVVYSHARPPLPPQPWVTQDPSVGSPLIAGDIPLLRDEAKTRVANNYVPAHAPKALALAPLGGFLYLFGQESDDEAVRRVLELCGNNAGVPCMVVAVNDGFVVPVPKTMKAVGFFQPVSASAIAPALRDGLAQRLASGGGWSAVAAGSGGKVGVALKAANEQAAVDGAMADCAKQDQSCRVIAIGPFAVAPN